MNTETLTAQGVQKPLALLYVRVSTSEQVEEGASLDAQMVTLEQAAKADGFALEVVREEGRSAKNLRRPELQAAFARLDSGEAAALYVTRLDRLSRSVADFASVIDRAKRMGWRVRILDVGVDTSSPSGEFLVNVLAAAAQYERRIIGARTRDGMAQRKREGKHVGRAPVLSTEVFTDICLQKARGASLNAIARDLNERGVPTAMGGRKWYASTVKAVLTSSRMKSSPPPEVLEELGYVA
jgi:DNA invertase Pin-like site-specific DNA recombinase